MQKIKLSVQETLKYQREMVIEVPDGISEQTLNKILTDAERYAQSSEDFAYALDGRNGIQVTEYPDNNMSSPYNVEIESDYLRD